MSEARGEAKKPILRILESYVLAAIEALDLAEEQAARTMVSKAFGEQTDWRNRIREEFGLTPTLDQQLVAMWEEARRLAAERGAELAPASFARAVVEENFADTVEMVTTDLEREG